LNLKQQSLAPKRYNKTDSV